MRILHVIFSPLIFFCITQALWGQVPTVEADQIFFQKRLYPILTSPLDAYLAKYPPKANKPTIEHIYRGQWLIDNAKLFLTAVQTSRNSAPLGIEKQLPMIAEWYTGVLVAAMGKGVYFDLSGDPTSFSQYHLWRIEKGLALEDKTLSYQEYEDYKKRQFEVFKGTQEYQDMLHSLEELGLQGDLETYIFTQNIGFLDISIPFS